MKNCYVFSSRLATRKDGDTERISESMVDIQMSSKKSAAIPTQLIRVRLSAEWYEINDLDS
ncbi:hypothetical protein [Metabacillus litoralis]|uniref:hypothetical protein n=1 Tax=Metabacillus litoralis TaxID=152268 RepID=UPI00203BDE3E|nr:hypothetical protein [Metabacillus litoralis]MCM3654650.1 hypothetical protein [Metabacillus litoralis]